MISEIIKLEENIIEAILYSDVAVLDGLLHTDLVFVNHLGVLVSKQDDLAPHLSGELKFKEILIADQQISVFGDTVVVSVFKDIKGSYLSQDFESRVRFTRVWKLFEQGWKVIAATSVSYK
ncbi:nuclear transport factor 2 family protein [Pedobacter heparinus]|uniref:nuclear transport factor 2 family protein n=1 Tax=Pedobacter heparinus TaxID=984 RepID=UPI0029311A34|nr:nuclear transport factor 2 family protein [Pedobacter heparinus]